MKSPTKILAGITLLSILFVALGGAFTMMHMNDEMGGGCPFSTVSASICPQNLFTQALHHISAYNSFFSVYISSFTLLSLLVFMVLMLWTYQILFEPRTAVSGLISHSLPRPFHKDKFIHWLSLFEHSPSF